MDDWTDAPATLPPLTTAEVLAVVWPEYVDWRVGYLCGYECALPPMLTMTAMTEHIVTTHLGPLAAIAEAAREYVRAYHLCDSGLTGLPLYEAQEAFDAACDALVAAVEAERAS